jgi:hypothetical protein
MGSSTQIDQLIYVFGGLEFDSNVRMRSIQRIEITEEDNIENVTMIGENNKDYYYPVLYHAENDFCVS